MLLGAHNVFNNAADGYDIAPNQRYSISDLLKAGIRVVDQEYPQVQARAATGGPGPRRAEQAERFFSNAVKEVAQFLLDHDKEVVVINLEAWEADDDDTESFWDRRVNDPIEVFLDRKDIGVFTPADYASLGHLCRASVGWWRTTSGCWSSPRAAGSRANTGGSRRATRRRTP